MGLIPPIWPHSLGIAGLDLDALYIASDGMIYFSVVGIGDILQSTGDGTNSVFLLSSDLGAPGYDVQSFSPLTDSVSPTIQITQPPNGSVTNILRPAIAVSFQEQDSAINTSDLTVLPLL